MKPGLKTSEFWLVIAYLVRVLANGTAYVNVPWPEMASLGAAVFGYSVSRGLTKRSGP